MSVLMQHKLPGLSRFGEGLHHQVRLLGRDVEIVQAVYDQRRTVDPGRVERIVPLRPEFVVIAVRDQLVLRKLPQEGRVVVVDNGPVVVQVRGAAVVGSEVVHIGRALQARLTLGIGIVVP